MEEAPLPNVIDTFGRVITKMQEYSGLSNDEILARIGEQIGQAISTKFSSKDLKGLLDEMAGMRLQLKLGEMDVQRMDPPLIKIYGCNGCVQMPDSEGKTYCPFGEGLLKGLIKERLGFETEVKMVESVGRGTGFNVCTFVIHKK